MAAAASPASPAQGHGGAAGSKQDMHFQMSKKLAQLTKVIYSLNTKNDKHEEEVQALKDAHTKELQQHAAETGRHLLELQTKLGDEENMCKKLQNLENVLAKQERLRHEEKVAFDAYRRKMTREEARTLELERRVLAMKKDLHEKTEHFSRLRVRFADDKQAALKELSKVHQLEMEKARKDYDNEISATRQRLEAQNDSEKSKEKINSCQSQSMEEPLEQEPSRCASRNSQNAWQEKDLELRLQFETQEMEIRHTCKEKVEQLQESLRSLEQDLQQSQGENSNLRSENLKFQTELKDNRSELEILRRNLAVAKEKEAVNLMQLKDSQESLQVAREALEQQTELVHKANVISSLEAFKLAQHTSFPEREDQVAHLQNKLNEAERLSTSLQQQKQTLETLYEEEKSLRENQAQESNAQRSVAAKEMQQLKDQHQESLVWINQQHGTEMERILAQTHQKRKAVTVDFEQQMQALKLQLVSEVSHANKLHESEIIELQSKLEMANKEVSQMQRQLQQSEQGRSSAEAHILNLCEAQKELQAEMQVVQDKVGEAQSSVSALQNQLKTERQEFAKQITLQDEGMRRIQQNTKYLKVKWMETMRVECDRIRDTMAAQFRQQRWVSLLELEQKKEQEGAAVQRCWEKQIQELQEQILQYKQTIEEQKSKTETSIWQLQGEHQFQLEQATNSFQAAHQEYLEGLKAVQEAQQQTLQDIKKTHQQEIEDLNNYLQQQNEDALQSHHQAIRLLKEKAQQEMDTARDQWQEQHQKELDELRLELTRQQTATTEQLCRNHKQQLSAGLRERERALESSLTQEREDALRNRELQLSLTDSKQSLHMAQRDNEKLRWELADLENKLEDNVRMMKEVQTEVSNHFRNCIEEMKQRLESERQQMTADHVHENQNLLHEYNAAQDLLKEKISTLENELLEAQKALKQWKLWTEDRERISDLQDLLGEQEHLIRSLMEDKKYYELELANREVNYNKIFNANPKVGIVNPLQKKGDCKNGGAYFINVPKFNSLPIGRRGRLLPPLSGTMQHSQRFSLCDRIFSMTPPSKTKKQLRDGSASSGLPCLNGN